MRILLCLSLSVIIISASIVTSLAQAPASLADFNGKVIRFQAVTNLLGGPTVGALIRIIPTNTVPYTNGTSLISGGLFSLGAPTNVFYTQLAGDRALMRLQSSASASFYATNEVSMTFLTATSGLYTNVLIYSSYPVRQTNSAGLFTVLPGTNAVPAVDYITGGGIVQPGNAVSLSAGGNGFAVKYQWRSNGTNVPGATNTFLNIAAVTPELAGSYVWVASNELGSATSSVVNVTIADPIIVLQHPQSQSVMEGSYLTMSYAATGGIKYATWMLNGSQAAGVNSNTTYTIPQITALKAGNYAVQLNGYGTATNGYPFAVTTSNALISVRSAGVDATWLGRPFVKIADDRAMAVPNGGGHVFTNWNNPALTPLITYRDGQVIFVAGTSAGVRSLFRWTNGVLSTLVFTNTPNPLGGFFGDVFYPTDEGNGVVNFLGNSVVNGGMFAYSALGISNVISANTIAPGQAYPFGGSGSHGRRNSGVAISASLFTSPGSYVFAGTGMYFHDGTNITRLCDNTTDLPGALTGYAGRPTANSVNFDGTNVVFSTVTGGGPGGFFKSTPGGVVTKLADHTDPLPEDPFTTFSNFGDLDVDGGLIFGVANSGVYAFETNGAATNIGYGLAVSAAGPRMAYYHTGSWIYRWNDGATEAVFTGAMIDGRYISSILAIDGQGDDVVMLVKFSDNSHGIYLVRGTASALPVITSEPLDFTVIENGVASFWVSAAGQGPLSYQWFKDGAPLASRTNTSVLMNPVLATDAGGYAVVVSNLSGSVTSRVAQLTRIIPATPMIHSGPLISPSSPQYGSNATIYLNAAGQNLTYTWYKNGAVLPGANTNFIAFTNLGGADRTNYFCVLSNSASVLTSSVVNLTVSPVITLQPVSVTNVIGASAAFTVAANGIEPLTYLWRRGTGTPNVTIAGATSPTLNFASLDPTNALNYRVIVTSQAGGASATSQTVKLVVLSATPPNSPMLSAPVVANGQFQFLLPTQTGYSYQVQSKTNLMEATWTLEQTIPGDGTVKLVTVDATAAQKWLRVMAQ